MNDIKKATADLEKRFGKGTVRKVKDMPFHEIEAIPSGNILLDMAIGIGGYPRGRIMEVYGPESSGKTTLSLHAVAEAQRLGLNALFIDAEHALDPVYAENIGVDVDNIYISQPESGEEGLEVLSEMIKTGEFGIAVVDSVAALTPRAEIEGEMGDSHVGLQARLMGQAMRKIASNADRSQTLIIFINQLREKIGVMFGSPETTPGGRALKFYSSVRLDIRRIGALKSGDEIIGNQTRVKVAKNKVGPPFRQVEFDIVYGEGISQAGSVLDLAVTEGLIEKSGAWYTIGAERIQGREAAKQYLKDNPDVMGEYYNKLAYEEEG